MKQVKHDSVGVEVTREGLAVVALGAGRKPVFAEYFSFADSHVGWETKLSEVLTNLCGKAKRPAKWALALPLRSQQLYALRYTYGTPEIEQFREWYLKLYTGQAYSSYVHDSDTSECLGVPEAQVHELAIRQEEAQEIGQLLVQAQLAPGLLDSSALATLSGIVDRTQVQNALIFKLEHGRSTWLSVREGALQAWGDFATVVDSEDALNWSVRLREKMAELTLRWPSRDVFLCGELLTLPSVVQEIALQFDTCQIANTLGDFAKRTPAQNAVFVGAWAMALRAGEEL